MYNSYKRKCMDRRDFIIHFCIGKHLHFKKKLHCINAQINLFGTYRTYKRWTLRSSFLEGFLNNDST